MHDRLSVSGLCFPGRSATDVLGAVAEIGAGHTTLQLPAVSEAGEAAVRGRSDALGVTVEALIAGGGPVLEDRAAWPAARDRLTRAIDLAAGVGATTIYMLTGSRQSAPWEEAVERFATCLAPCLEHSASASWRGRP